jgi:hypothetical protein
MMNRNFQDESVVIGLDFKLINSTAQTKQTNNKPTERPPLVGQI